MYKNIIDYVNNLQIKKNIKEINSGNFVEIEFYIDKLKKRSQKFSGIVISKKNNKLLSSIIVRKISNNEGIEKTFYIHSPNIINILIYKKIKFRKSKLYFLRYNNKKIL